MFALSENGIQATQATVSRDLSALGAIRTTHGYQLAGSEVQRTSMSDDLSQLLQSHAFEIQQAHSMIVIKTAPGHAQLLAVGFDRTPLKGVVGCLAGDDTIFLATSSPKTAERVSGLLNTQLKGDAT